ncbi:HemK2/MTQ2 family protein methyltransferase [Actinomadura sp. HBU206391]|uniref:HemK2/MTQ2 family protein methyltransferase n=1 Tax=Actinomadura sp. HBU206391 TaxID=2731692 RepID=UPI00290596B6|nr:HemK2/MTQ2 family protein methyltransferase [Actinomadura sp. HBU206391]
MYAPQGDTELLARELRRAAVAPGARVLDLCSGTGALAVAAALAGARDVTAVDISLRAVLATWVNARVRGIRVRPLRGDLFSPVAGETFDVILANPPYVPSESDRLPRHGPARAWDAGTRGRAVLDRICASAPTMLASGGTLLMVQSALCDVRTTLGALQSVGMTASVVARRAEPFGPVMLARAALLEERGLARPGHRYQELVVVRADRPRRGSVHMTR